MCRGNHKGSALEELTHPAPRRCSISQGAGPAALGTRDDRSPPPAAAPHGERRQALGTPAPGT